MAIILAGKYQNNKNMESVIQEWIDWANSPSDSRSGRHNVLPEVVSFIVSESAKHSGGFAFFLDWWKNPKSAPTGVVFTWIPEVWEAISEELMDQCLENTFGERHSSLKDVPDAELQRLLNGHVNLDSKDIDNFIQYIKSNHNWLTIEGTSVVECSQAAYGEIVIPDGVVSIPNSAFDKCKNITLVILPSNLSFIEDYAFNGCSLKKIYIQSEKVRIDCKGFAYSRPKELYLKFYEPIKMIKEWFYGEFYENYGSGDYDDCLKECTLYVPQALLSEYLEDENKDEFKDIVAE